MRLRSPALPCLRLPPTSPSALRVPVCFLALLEGTAARGYSALPFCVALFCVHCSVSILRVLCSVFCYLCSDSFDARLVSVFSCIMSCVRGTLRLSRRTMRFTFPIPPSECLSQESGRLHWGVVAPSYTYSYISFPTLRDSGYRYCLSPLYLSLRLHTHGVLRGAVTLSAGIVGICIIFMLYNLGTLVVVDLTSLACVCFCVCVCAGIGFGRRRSFGRWRHATGMTALVLLREDFV